MKSELRDRLRQTLQEAERRYIVEGTSENDNYLPPYKAPWFVIDSSTAEPEVNWPGELVEQFEDPQAALNCRAYCIVDALIAELEK